MKRLVAAQERMALLTDREAAISGDVRSRATRRRRAGGSARATRSFRRSAVDGKVGIRHVRRRRVFSVVLPRSTSTICAGAVALARAPDRGESCRAGSVAIDEATRARGRRRNAARFAPPRRNSRSRTCRRQLVASQCRSGALEALMFAPLCGLRLVLSSIEYGAACECRATRGQMRICWCAVRPARRSPDNRLRGSRADPCETRSAHPPCRMPMRNDGSPP